MKNMFSKCSSLNYLNISNFYFNKNTNSIGILKDCKSLKKLDINNIKYPEEDVLNTILVDIDKNCEIIKKN
jgi:hypothetical protein